MAVGVSYPTPEAGWKRYQALGGVVKFEGSWGIEYNSSYQYGKRMASPRTASDSKYSFKVKGTGFRIIASIYPEYVETFFVTVDGETKQFTQKGASTSAACIAEYTGLTDKEHLVTVTKGKSGTWSVDMILEAIDVLVRDRALHVDEVTEPTQLTKGKKIRSYATMTQNYFGFLTGLGREVGDFIDPTQITGNSYRQGDFYYIMVDEINGKKVLLSDRYIGPSITGSDLIGKGLMTGIRNESYDGLLPLVPTMYSNRSYLGHYVTHSNNTYSTDFGWRVFDTAASSGRPFWYANGSGDKWIDIELPVPETVVAVGFGTAAISGSQMGVYNYEFYGHNDDGSMDLLFKGTKSNNADYAMKRFDNTKKYKKYRFLVISSWNAATTALVSPLQLFKAVEESKVKGAEMRLITGGIQNAPVDKYQMNEHDRYILQSGLSSIWDWHYYSGLSVPWQWVSSWNSSVGYGVVRGYANPQAISYSGFSGAYGFRPLLTLDKLIMYPKMELDRDKYLVARGDGAVMKLSVIPDRDYPNLEWAVRARVGDTYIYYSGKKTGSALLNITIPPRLFTSSEELPVTVEMLGEHNAIEDRVRATAQIVNSKPDVNLSLEGYKLQVDIVDPDGDPMYYDIKLNGEQLYGPGEAMGVLRTDIYLNSSMINIGVNNTITAFVRDLYGDETTVELNFMGEYVGLIFSSEDGSIYSTDGGEIVRRLVIPSVRAGKNSDPVPVLITNKFPFNVRELNLDIAYYEDLPKTRIYIGTQEDNATDTIIRYDDMMSPNQFKKFYVRLETDDDAVGQGKFRIRAGARKV